MSRKKHNIKSIEAQIAKVYGTISKLILDSPPIIIERIINVNTTSIPPGFTEKKRIGNLLFIERPMTDNEIQLCAAAKEKKINDLQKYADGLEIARKRAKQ